MTPSIMTLGVEDLARSAAVAAGGRRIKAPHDIFWGGYSSYFADPDGHVWEIAHNPFSPPRADGSSQWGG